MKNGIDVFVSPDLRDNLQKVIELKCKIINSECYQSVQTVLVGQQTFLEARQLSAAVAAGAIPFLGIFYPLWYDENQYLVPVSMHIPPAQLS